MALAYDAGSGGGTGFDTSVTFSHTCSGSDRLLCVGVCTNAGGDPISGVTYNGVAMTRQARAAYSVQAYLYTLVAPDTGAHNVVVSATGAIAIAVVSGSFTGVDQATPVTATNESNHTGTDTSHSTSITVGAGGVGVGFFGTSPVATGLAVSGAQSQISTQRDFGVTAAGTYLADATSLGWTYNSDYITKTQIVGALKAATGGASAVPLLMQNQQMNRNNVSGARMSPRAIAKRLGV